MDCVRIVLKGSHSWVVSGQGTSGAGQRGAGQGLASGDLLGKRQGAGFPHSMGNSSSTLPANKERVEGLGFCVNAFEEDSVTKALKGALPEEETARFGEEINTFLAKTTVKCIFAYFLVISLVTTLWCLVLFALPALIPGAVLFDTEADAGLIVGFFFLTLIIVLCILEYILIHKYDLEASELLEDWNEAYKGELAFELWCSWRAGQSRQSRWFLEISHLGSLDSLQKTSYGTFDAQNEVEASTAKNVPARASRELAERLVEVFFRQNDMVAFGNLFSDDIVLTGSIGNARGRADVVALFKKNIGMIGRVDPSFAVGPIINGPNVTYTVSFKKMFMTIKIQDSLTVNSDGLICEMERTRL